MSAPPVKDIEWPAVALPGLIGRGGYVVLGAGGAIGFRVVEALLGCGAWVLATARSADALDRIAARIKPDKHDRLARRAVDVVDEDACRAAFEQAAEQFGGLHGAVNAAAVGDGGMLGRELDRERARAVIDTNLLGTLVPAAAAFPHLSANGGSLVNMASIAAYRAMPRGVVYAASKAGVVATTRQLAIEWGPSGVRVNCVSPAQTPTTIRGLSDPVGQAPQMQQRGPAGGDAVPLRRMGMLDDYAGPTLFLLSDLARYITGQDILVDGGIAGRRFTN